MEKLWNLSKTKFHIWKNYGIFVMVEKKVRAFFKKWGENTSGLRNVVSMFVASVITSLSLALQTSRSTNLPGYSASLGRVNTC